MFEHCAVIIPTYNPEPELIPYVEELKAQGIQHVIVINDGSLASTQSIFDALASNQNCTVLVHEVNQGKGSGLKTAFRYIKEERPELRAVVTADADGQHAVEDVLALCRFLEQDPAGIVLGVRNFNEEHVPSKNAFGNKLTSRVFKLLFGTYLMDTQTGLRGFSRSELDWLLALKGERFEYEMNMLMYAVQQNIPVHEVPIQTLYFGEKHATHYKTFYDSFRIAKQLLIGLIVRKRLVERKEISVRGGTR